jgi:hypothetical protein
VIVDFNKDTELFRTFSTPLEAPYEDAETILQLELINLHCSDELGCKFNYKSSSSVPTSNK